MANKEDLIFNAGIEENFKGLLLDIEKSKLTALSTHQTEIRSKLADEIVKRYTYREGLYQYYLKNDDAILSATELLSNASKYQGILK